MIKKASRRCVFPLSLLEFPSRLLPSSLQISPSLWPCMTPAELANQAPSSCKAGWLAHMHQQAQTRTAGNESLHQRLALDSSVHQSFSETMRSCCLQLLPSAVKGAAAKQQNLSLHPTPAQSWLCSRWDWPTMRSQPVAAAL